MLKNNHILILFILFIIPGYAKILNPLQLLKQFLNPELKKTKSKKQLSITYQEKRSSSPTRDVSPLKILTKEPISDEEDLALHQEKTRKLEQLERPEAFKIPDDIPEWECAKNRERMLAYIFDVYTAPQTIFVLSLFKFYKKKGNELKTASVLSEIERIESYNPVFKFMIIRVRELASILESPELLTKLNNSTSPWIPLIINDTKTYLDERKITLPALNSYLIIPNDAELFARTAAQKELIIKKYAFSSTPEWHEAGFALIKKALEQALIIKKNRMLDYYS